ncbi:GH1 family beta-glucosidase [Marmoricola sp. RAF53]|uniref:GH1 family beta-glucosidase n=1 Tax=Marmoricola sp. RAF53 TaxID=3233059 RepID=UPI003F9D08D9
MTATKRAAPPDRVARAAAGPDPGSFPADFVWGAATASYQIEGAVAEDGRTPSIWDAFAATPGRVRGGDTGAVACDHYHRYAEDVDLVAGLGLGAYRFSLAWPRICPDSDGRVNAAGLDFYDRLVDALLAQGVTPWATLYHWDLPQVLEERGGWPSRDTVDRFVELTAAAHDRLGDRVHHWITLNEPWCSAFLGYASGLHAPGRTDGDAAVAAAHHLLLAHGRAVEVLRADPQAQVGISVNLYPVVPLDDRPGNLDAARRIDGLQNRWFLDPLLLGSYPADVLEDLGLSASPAWLRDGDLAEISRPLDFLGINYYTRHTVRSGAYPGSAGVEFLDPRGPLAANGWGVEPDGLADILTRITRDYGDVPLVVTENGSAWDDAVDAAGAVEDAERTDYLASHLEACSRAIAAGVPLRGYFAWSLLDNFEWAEGYAVRFGLVHVDYATQKRTTKASGRWYARFVEDHRASILGP